jgi:hypothetical protein
MEARVDVYWLPSRCNMMHIVEVTIIESLFFDGPTLSLCSVSLCKLAHLLCLESLEFCIAVKAEVSHISKLAGVRDSCCVSLVR